jgi:hypothetical protein
VFPAHGSGIGAGLVAARLLADVVGRGAPLRAYEVEWQRRHGGLLAAFEVVRRWNQDVDGATLGRIFDRGLVDDSIVRAGIDQVLPRPRLRDLAGKARALAGSPALARGVVSAVARSVAVRGLYATYPRRAERVPAWARRVAWVAG